MKPSDELFQLIKSLTKSEKRYFKLFSSLQSGQKNYMRLFDAIEEQKVYDEAAIKKQFEGETFIKHLPSEKNHLFNLILKSLRQFHSDKTAAAQLQEILRNIELLFNKALYKECHKLIKRGKKIAYKYEKFYFLLDLIDWQKRLIEEEVHSGKFDQDMNELVDEETNCLEKLRNQAEYQKLYSQINYVFRRGGYNRNEEEQQIVQNIVNHPLIKGKNTAISTKAATACYYIKGMCAVTEKNLEEELENFGRVVKIMEENPPIMQELPKRYLRALNNLMFAYLDYRNFDKFFELNEKIRNLSGKPYFDSIDIEIKIFTLTRNALLLGYELMGQYDKAINELVPDILQGIDHYNDKINREEVILFYYNISTLYFGKGMYKEALRYLNLVLNVKEEKLRQDVLIFAHFFNLIIHFELGNYDLLEYIIKSTKRLAKKKQKFYKMESTIIKYMKKLIKAGNKFDQMPVFEAFEKEINEVLKDPFEMVVTEYFDINSWIKSKLTGKTIEELKREQLTLNN